MIFLFTNHKIIIPYSLIMPRFCDSFTVKPTVNPIGGHITQDIIISTKIINNHNINIDPLIHNDTYQQVYESAYAYYLNIFSNFK